MHARGFWPHRRASDYDASALVRTRSEKRSGQILGLLHARVLREFGRVPDHLTVFKFSVGHSRISRPFVPPIFQTLIIVIYSDSFEMFLG